MTYGLEVGIVGGIGPGNVRPPAQTQWHEDGVRIIDYTGRAARGCDGTREPGDMVVEYTLRSSSPVWTVAAHLRAPHEFGGPGITPVFEMLQGIGSLTSNERRHIAIHWARAFTSPWTPPSGPRRQAGVLHG
jgi:hypothetical protein